MTNEERAERLYQLLKKDSEGCFDVKVERFENQVTYKGQGGLIGIDFDELSLTQTGDIRDTFDCDSKEDVAEQYVTGETTSLQFYKTHFGSIYATITYKFETLDLLYDAISISSIFDLEGVEDLFKEGK